MDNTTITFTPEEFEKRLNKEIENVHVDMEPQSAREIELIEKYSTAIMTAARLAAYLPVHKNGKPVEHA